VWHTHQGDPHAYKTETEAIIGIHFRHDDSINDRASDAPLAQLQAATEVLFEKRGLPFFQPGGMYRGTPTLLSGSERAAAQPGVRSKLCYILTLALRACGAVLPATCHRPGVYFAQFSISAKICYMNSPFMTHY
jgi:hypothetical protein